MTKPSFSRARLTALLGGALVCAGALTIGCLERPVVPQRINTTNVILDQINNSAIDKIDLLFVVDNSVSMADKQQILENAVPRMVTRLVQPDCVVRDEAGKVIPDTRKDSVAGACTGENYALEFEPINDIHIGVITSSLGDHGSDSCDEDATKNNNDKSYLMPSKLIPAGPRGAVPDPTGQGFLVWYPQQKDGEPVKPIENDIERLTNNFRQHVVAAGENGCGFEAQLEAWYRFLIDPSPPADLVVQEGVARSTGVDENILAQRAAFLRPDSLVAIVLLTDENDCSVMEGGEYYNLAGSGWRLTNRNARLPVASAACENNPNDPCCFSCLLTAAPSACKDPNAYSVCNGDRLAPENDALNARCFQNKRRFGIDLLYPTNRYVDGLTKAKIIDSQTGKETFNPLLTGVDGKTPRGTDLVFFAGIVGVPWQDISTPESYKNANGSLNTTTLKYLTADELKARNVPVAGGQPVSRWDLILGTPNVAASARECRTETPGQGCGIAPVPPLDPFMIESQKPRTGANPLYPELAITTAPAWNPVNGHEYDVGALKDGAPANDDLQYACIFSLEDYDAVKTNCDPGDGACDCGSEGVVNKGSPLCKNGPTGAVGTTQYYGKAYPAPRVLEVLKDFGDNAIVASICPKISAPTSPDFGYNPAVGAIVDRLAEKLGGQCLSRKLIADKVTGEVSCRVVEVLAPANGSLDCAVNGRADVDAELRPAVVKQLIARGQCANEAECKQFTMCLIPQLAGDDAGAGDCLNAPKGSEADLPTAGYCYVDPDAGIGAEQLVSSCRPTERRLLRFVGKDTPLNKSITFIACSAGDDSLGAGAPAAPAEN